MQLTAKGDLGPIEINASQNEVYSVLFAENGSKQVVWSGSKDGMLRRWGVNDGREVGQPIGVAGAEIYAAALSPDRKWLVCGLRPLLRNDKTVYVKVWDAQTGRNVLDIKGHTNTVFSVDVSPDSTKIATGSYDNTAVIWSIRTGKKLIGPLQHQGVVVAVRFSPDGDRIATATGVKNLSDMKSIRIYDSSNGQQLLNIPCWFSLHQSTRRFAWSADRCQLFVASYSEVKILDPSSGSLLNEWSVPGVAGCACSIVLSQSQKFAAVAVRNTLTFWDISTHVQIGTSIQHASGIWSIALSSSDDCIVTGENSGKVIIRSLRHVLPLFYTTANSQLPLTCINGAAFASWTQGDLRHADELLTKEITYRFQHARALAQRALVRSRLKQWDMAIDDAKQSIEIERSVIGYIASAIAGLGDGKSESALDVFDFAFAVCERDDSLSLLLIRAVIMFECGKHDSALSRVDGLINMVDDKSPYVVVRAQMLLLLGGISLGEGQVGRAMELLHRAQDAMPIRTSDHLTLVSLIFGWEFDQLDLAIQTALQQCIKPSEDLGDAAMQAKNLEEAVLQYSAALLSSPSNPASLFVKRSTAYGALKLWENALKDADDAIKADSGSPWGYEARYTALHASKRYDEALDALTRMFSLVEGSRDQDIRNLAGKYVSPSRWTKAIDDVIREISKKSPLVLIDVKSGHLCDEGKRSIIFKSAPEFKELISSMKKALDDKRIRRVVEEFFRYVTLSHVWEGEDEPLMQDVNRAGSVKDLNSSSPRNKKLQDFCDVVLEDGYRWAWSDTCCIDKTISTVLNLSLRMMYRWYESSAATFVFLTDVETLSALLGLKDSKWMTRAWTSQELLSPKVIRFYTRDWKPYLGDARRNHKESPEILQELADAIKIAHQTIVDFDPSNLTIRERLRLASTRNATVEEDVAYSLIGIFKSDIRTEYGEGYAALGHLLEEIVARSGEVTVLDWTGKSSPYNTCLPSSLKVYSRPPGPSHATDDGEMEARVAELKGTLSEKDIIPFHDQIASLSPARFTNRRLHLPCIIFQVRRLGVQTFGQGQELRYRARVSAIGDVDFQTSDKLSPSEPRKLIFVHPWIRDLCDPSDGFTLGQTAGDDGDDGEFEFGPEDEDGSVPLDAVPVAAMDEYTRALRLIVRLQKPFHALLLQQQSRGEFQRVAAEHEIVVQGVPRGTDFSKDVCTAVVEIL